MTDLLLVGRIARAHGNKGQVIVNPDTDFRVAVGDDRTDEDMFTRAGSEWWTIKVGEAPTAARFSVPDNEAVCRLLDSVARGEMNPVTRAGPLVG